MRADYERATVLTRGARGHLDGAPFTLAGRTCVEARRGAIWSEWRMRFDDGRTLFLVEAAGTFTVYEEGSLSPAFDAVAVGAPLDTGYVVIARGEARRVAAWGDVEAAPSRYAYVELSSRSGAAATIDFGAPPPPGPAGAGARPRVYLGRRVNLAALGLTATSAASPWLVPAPDVSRPKGVEAWLDVGDEGELDGVRFRVVGVLSRSLVAASAKERVSWEEYLLFAPEIGLRWLVVLAGHWSLVEPIDAGRVAEGAGGAVVLDGVVYEGASAGAARVDWATGALPWQVAVGDTSNVADFVHAPCVLTKEWTADELTWSRGTHVTPDVIAKAFAKRSLPKPEGRAPHEP
ncbi:MAG: DUF4178 domain-containing protein [Labilithrix sp.]|nr:DUF4178 domain-containing protein [Labilithrix sp.]